MPPDRIRLLPLEIRRVLLKKVSKPFSIAALGAAGRCAPSGPGIRLATGCELVFRLEAEFMGPRTLRWDTWMPHFEREVYEPCFLWRRCTSSPVLRSPRSPVG